jgi:ubiquinone/menaquinone biosynthesis C-methylase UbiE
MYHNGNQLIDPQFLFEKIQLQQNMHVADFGCGRTGHIVFPASQIIGEHGVVYAVDIMKDVLENITKRARMENVTNMYTIWSDIEKAGKTTIPEKSLNIVFLINTLYQITNTTNTLNEANRLLKNKSRILVVDWIKNNLPIGPRDDKLVNFNKIMQWAGDNNLAIQEQFQAGQYHKGMILYKNV